MGRCAERDAALAAKMLAPNSDLAPHPDAPDDAAAVTDGVGPEGAPAATAVTGATAMLAERPAPFPDFDRTKCPDRQKPAKDPAKKPNPGLAYQYYCASEKKRRDALAERDDDEPSAKPLPVGPAQREALDKRDVLEAILRHLGGDTYRETGKTAARWCVLNKAHWAARKTHAPWKDLTQAAFPGVRAPNASNHEPTHPMDWFFFLCNRHARAFQLIIFAMHKRRGMEQYHKMRAMTREEQLAPYREQIASVREAIRESNKPGILITTDQIGGLKRALQHWKTKLREMDERIRTLHKSPFANSDEDDPARLLGEYAQLEAWLRGLCEDPDADPFAPFRDVLQSHWEPSWGVWLKPWWGPQPQ